MAEQTNEQKIAELDKKQAVTDVKLDAINQSIIEIKTNHLVHINDSLSVQNKAILDLGTNFNDKVSQIYSKISELRIQDAKQEPTNNIVTKVIEYIIIAVVAGGIAFLVSQR